MNASVDTGGPLAVLRRFARACAKEERCELRDVFERLNEHKRRNGLPTWERALERLLEAAEAHSTAKETMFDLML
jgi:hypothetical protein